MEQLLSYQRDFSTIPGLQEAKTIHYVLHRQAVQGQVCYGARVTEIGVKNASSDGVVAFTDCRVRAEALLSFLYENAVTPANCVSVISDVCARWEEERGGEPNSAAHCG